jgi:opacity protein-like surface antigen
MRRRTRVTPLAFAVLGCLFLAPPAAADLTGFFGAATTPQTRPALGVAVGGSLVVVGWEIEYARATEDEGDFAPAVTTFMGNVLAQNPVPLNGMTFYATVGAGVYREALGDESTVNVGTNLGGGVKIDISGPLRLRLDYRLFTFAGEPLHKTPQRFYAGLTITF